MKRAIVPLLIFLVIVGFLAIGLKLDPREVPSPLVGKPAPLFSLPKLDNPEQMFSPKDMLGQVWLLNVWASWCGACKEEHPVLVALSRGGSVPVYGMNYKDTRAEALQVLMQDGNPDIASAMRLM